MLLSSKERFGSLGKKAWFEFRAEGLRWRRRLQDISIREATAFEPNLTSNLDALDVLQAEFKSPLWTASSPGEENLVAGKVQNLRLAARALQDRVIPAGGTFSFWQNVGAPHRRRGYVAGRELREGCLVASIGGGLCQLSNALYNVALAARLEIVERHAHSQVIAGSLAEMGRDATVFWNYKDLRFRSTHAFRLEVELSANELIVRLFSGRREPTSLVANEPISFPVKRAEKVDDCVECEHKKCIYRLRGTSGKSRPTYTL